MPYPSNQLNPDAKIGIISRGILNIPHIETLLGHPVVKRKWGRFTESINAIAGWGHKSTSLKTRNYAKANHIPYLAVEDGFLRSIELGNEHPPQSIVIDDLGIYYDANTPTRLESLIKRPINPEQQQRTQALIKQWQDTHVSKYNHLREYEGTLPDKYVLLADQTYGDASVELGLADENSFRLMIEDAIELYQDSIILIKTHPDVASGKKRGYINTCMAKSHPRIKFLNDNVHPVRLIKEAQAIFTVTSQIGFEGLIWNKKIHTYGMPFYAGWGLTNDYLPRPLNRQQVDKLQLVHAALIDYSYYLDPESNQRCEVEDLIKWVHFQRKLRTEFASNIYAYKFPFNKRNNVKRYLTGSNVHFVNNLKTLPPNSSVAVWGSMDIDRKDLKIIRLEDGFLRSVGLGADLIRPLSWVVDDHGIYYDPTKPSKLDLILQNLNVDQNMLDRAKRLHNRIVESGISKYNLSGKNWNRPAHVKNVILVPGQVESDASIAKGSLHIKHNIELLRIVRQNNPDAYIVYKPHPDVLAKLRKEGFEENQAEKFCDEIVKNASINLLLDCVDEVHVMTSLTGFEALLRKKKVFTYGRPFYAGYGLTTDLCQQSNRKVKRNIYELITGVLIIYPRYIVTKQSFYSSPESVLDRIIQINNLNPVLMKIIKSIRRFFVRLII